MTDRVDGYGRLLRPAEVAKFFSVTARTVSRWAEEGKLPYVVTPGGHRRFRFAEVRQVLHLPSSEDFEPPT